MKFGFKNKKIAARLIVFFQVCLFAFVFDLHSAYAIPPVNVTNTTSSSISLQWPSISGATGYNIYIAPEPGSLGIEPDRKLVASLGNSTFTYQITNLSPNTDVFIRIRGVGVSNYYDVYAKTLGGQTAALDSIITSGQSKTGIQSIHLYAPDILLLIIRDERAQSFSQQSNTLDGGVEQLLNYTGPTWQSGSWSITRNNGTVINVTNKYRDSIPVGNLYEGLVSNGEQWGGAQNSHLMDVEHYIYLKLDSAIGQKEILNIAGPNNLSLKLPFSDQYLETPVIQLNQVGYNPRATKRYAYVSGWMGDGGPLSLSNFPTQAKVLVEPSNTLAPRSAAVSDIPVALRASFDTAAGTEVKEINLAGVSANDTVFYRVQLPGVGVSYRTMVSELATLKAFYTTTRAMFMNRWGRDLDCTYTDWCDRAPDHPTVYTAEKPTQGFFPSDTPLTGQRSLVGGHHDAGDFDLRVYHSIVARQLMRAFELNSAALTDNQLNIPESNNGIPDFLDEALWSIASWEQLQEADGGVRSGVESHRHPWGNYFADADPLPYWTYARDPVHTLRVAGLFAQASRLVAPYNAGRAATLRTEAIAAYNYAINAGVTDAIGGPLFYAASELYRLTGDAQYKTKFETAWTNNQAFNTGMPTIRQFEYWTAAYALPSNQPILADHVLGYLTSSANDATKTTNLNLAESKFTADAASVVTKVENNYAHRSGKEAGWANDWGKSVALGEYLMGIYSKLQLGTATTQQQQDYLNAMSLSVDYILGGNPMGMSWITGLGSRSPQNPLHNDSIAFVTRDGLPPMPGIVVYGPISSVPAASYYEYGKNAMYPSFVDRPSLRKYVDLRSFVSTNEFTIWETQSNVSSLFATILGSGTSVPNSWKPGQELHKTRLPLSEEVSANSSSGSYIFAAPSTPDLIASSDTGSSNDDNVTTEVTTTFEGTAVAGYTVTLYSSLDGIIGSGIANGGFYHITSNVLSEGVHQITAIAYDNNSNYSAPSGALSIEIEWLDTDYDGLPNHTDTDDDNDGITDAQEAVDGTDPLDPGSFYVRLETTTYSGWNGFLNLWNVAEFINLKGTDSINVHSQLYSSTGQLASNSSTHFRILQGGETDLLVHDMSGFLSNTYGIIKNSVTGDAGDYDGRMVHYRAANSEMQFAFAMPFDNGFSGSLFVPFNTYQPSLASKDANNPVANWLSVTNLSGSAQNGQLIFYAQDGTTLGSRTLSLNSLTRQDISGHQFGINRVGLVEWRPSNVTAKFQLRNIRYYYDNVALNNSFDSAFQLDGISGSSQNLVLPLDTRSSSSIIEVANIEEQQISYDLTIYSAQGAVLRRISSALAPHASVHIIADPILLNSLGSAVIKARNNKKIMATVMQYGRTPSAGIEYLYGIHAMQPLGSVIKGSYNTFLEQDCRLLLLNPSAFTRTASISLTRSDLTTVLEPTSLSIPANGITEHNICQYDAPNNFGVVTVQPDQNNSVASYVIRYGKNNNYRFSTPVR